MHIKIVKRLINFYDIDGYIIPKNDEYFSEYSNPNRLKAVTGFTGSAGLAIILKNKNYLFVDGRYTLQAQRQSGSNFDIFEIPLFDFIRELQLESTVLPRGLIVPSPVTTTLLN